MNIPSTHTRWTNLIEPWARSVEEATGGRVQFTPYFASALAAAEENVDATENGICDIAEGACQATPGRFPLSELSTLPAWSSDSELNSLALWKAYTEIPAFQDEWSSVKVMAVAMWMPTHICSIPPIKTVEDWKGLKINSPGGLRPSITSAFGGVPLQVGLGDVQMSLEKGTIDGSILGPEPLWSRQWGEYLKYSTDFNFGVSSYYIAMNWDVWNGLPGDIQKIFDSLSGEALVAAYGRAADENHDTAYENLISQMGHELYILPADEAARWGAICKPLMKEYIDDYEAKGLPAREAFDVIMAEMPLKISLD